MESFHTVKPLDTETLQEIFDNYHVVATAEEHGLIGGLGSSVAEWLASQRYDKSRLLMFGTSDEFMHKIGSQAYARTHFDLTPEKMSEAVLAAHI